MATNPLEKINNIDRLLKNNINILIYPSYYFNPNRSLFPKELLKTAIVMELWKKNNISNNEKEIPDIKRINRITERGVIASLNENPQHRIKNNKKN